MAKVNVSTSSLIVRLAYLTVFLGHYVDRASFLGAGAVSSALFDA